MYLYLQIIINVVNAQVSKAHLLYSVNKRMDQWVTDDLVDAGQAKFPPSECNAGALTHGALRRQVDRK